jgi:predicted acetyltransferase
MSSDIQVRRIQDEQEAADFARILAWAFSVKQAEVPRWFEIHPPENVSIAICGGKVAAGLFHLPMGQWFGGRSVTTTGIAAVAVAPEARGRGIGAALMGAVVRDLYDRRVALSTLYPAALALYRAVGYEPAGSRFEIRVRPADIQIRDRDLELCPIGESDQAEVEEAYRVFASCVSGSTDRSRHLWHRVRNPGAEPAYGFLVRRHGAVEGYLYGTETAPDDRARYAVKLTDFVALTHHAGRNLLAFLADHRSLATELTWHGGHSGVLLGLLPEQTYGVRLVDHFATRVIDVQLALAQRGYPPFDAQLELEVIDPIIKQNQDRFVLETAHGEGTVRRGGRGAVRIHVRGLAALFTGFLSPHTLRRMGVLTADEGALATAAALFAGPAPCMADTF